MLLEVVLAMLLFIAGMVAIAIWGIGTFIFIMMAMAVLIGLLPNPPAECGKETPDGR